MKRRTFISASAALLVSSGARAVCGPIGQVGTMGLPMGCRLSGPMIIKQRCPEWCWAASASMIFAMHGHPLDQMKIVSAVFGAPVCAASGNTMNIASVLSGSWIDDNGVPFRSVVTGAYDPMNGVFAMNNSFVISELMADRPLLYCNTHHAMVVSEIAFFQTPMGANVQHLGVLDPWPYSQDIHPLSPPEMIPVNGGGQMTFLAAVQVIG